MSRNFELLERTAKEELLTPGSRPEILRPPIPFPALKGASKGRDQETCATLVLPGRPCERP